MAKKKKDDAPPGGWLGPPPTEGLPAVAELVLNKKGKGVWKERTLTRKERELQKEHQRRMAKADARGVWRFRWPPKD